MQTHHRTLANGLEVYIKCDHRAPVVLSQIWYKVGSTYEPTGITGISHMLEHMMFKGTTDYPYGQLEQLVEKHGGEQNAFTSYDFTAYYQFWHKDHLEKSLDIERSRMRDLCLDQTQFEQEKKVVIEERRMRTEDNPIGFAYERYMSCAYQSTPRHHPIIGWMSDIEQYTLADISSWYQQHYAPNNAIIVIIGDVDPAHTFDLVAKYFADIPRSDQMAIAKYAREIEPCGHKHIDLHKSTTQVPTLIIGYQVPSFCQCQDNKEIYALMVLDSLLGDNDCSYLQREIVRDRMLCASTQSQYDPFCRHESQFTIIALPQENVSLPQLQQEIIDIINRIREQGVDQAMLDRVKASIKADKIYTLDSLQTQGYIIGSLASLGLSTDYFSYLEQLDNITIEDVKMVANKYLTSDRLTSVHLTA